MHIMDLTSKSEEAAALMALLANAHRLRILCALQMGEQSVSALEEVVDLSQSALSQHLAKLRAAKIVSTRREAQTIYYAIADDRVGQVLALLVKLYCPGEKQVRATRRKRRISR
jgi:DNA-binding transcriptional ArsR family regulator